MKKNSPYVTLSVPADPRTINSDSVGNYLSSELILIRNFAALDAGHIPFNQPILSKEYRIVSVQNGEVSFSINLRPYHVGKGQILITIPGTILELRQRSSDLDMHMVVFCDLPPSETYDQPVLLETSEQTLSHIEHYFDLIGDVVQNPNWQPKTVRYLLIRLLHSSVAMCNGSDAHLGRTDCADNRLFLQGARRNLPARTQLRAD